MKITIVNNGSVPVAAPGEVSVAVGGSIELASRTIAEYMQMVEQYSSDDVIVSNELESADLPPLHCVMKSPADPAADAATVLACGFDILDMYGSAFSTTIKMYLGIFDDAACTVPSTTATLGTAATGTINSGTGTNAINVSPAAGVVSVTATISVAADQTVYLKAWADPTNLRPMDTSDIDSVDFTVTP